MCGHRCSFGDYRPCVLPRNPEVTPEDVDRVLTELPDEQAPWEPVEDGAGRVGRPVMLRLLATVGEETLVDQDVLGIPACATTRRRMCRFPGSRGEIVGMQHRREQGRDDRSAARTICPAEYAGKQMPLHLEVLAIDRKASPEIDDAFAQTWATSTRLQQLRDALAAEHAGAGTPAGHGCLCRGGGASRSSS